MKIQLSTHYKIYIAGFSIAAIISLLTCLTGCRQRKDAQSFYKTGTPPELWVKVLLLKETKNCSLTIHSKFDINNPQAQIKQAHFNRLNSPVNIEIINGKINLAGWSSSGDKLIITPENPFIFNINGNDYRGKLELILQEDANSFDVVNSLPIDSYLAGVIAAEMPSYWEAAALQSQTIAARTYCLYTKKRFGKNRHFDVRKTQANQVYQGVKAESPQIADAIKKTSGQVLTCLYPDGSEDIFPAYYSSICGGHTENSQNVFGESFETLSGVSCPYCKKIADPDFFSWSKVKVSKEQVSKKLLERYPNLEKIGQVKRLISIKTNKYKDFSRVASVKIIGSNGQNDTIRAEDLRLAIDTTGFKIKSAAFKIIDANDSFIFTNGRGFGHGVGLCQCGVQQMARYGKSAQQILLYYYPDSKIKKIY